MAKPTITSHALGNRHVTADELRALQLTLGRKVYVSGRFNLMSCWYEHPTRTATGKLRSYADTLRLANAAASAL